ncbi:hypothetical protein [Thiohalocapsa sp.]|uniref:hypothetical protein n=1 Tax=Thiohalocapsa sp. TaxID=2497641 RepID=UPI0025FDCEE8|nr:hypothetical protein [Thiohalocapsa sp.]
MARQRSDEQATPALPNVAASSQPTAQSEAMSGVAGASTLMAAIVVGAGLGLAAAAMLQPAARVEPALANLLHAMVGIKALLFTGALALVLLRLRGPVQVASVAGYAAGFATSAAALVWLCGLWGLLLLFALFLGGFTAPYPPDSRDPLLMSGLKRALPPGVV